MAASGENSMALDINRSRVPDRDDDYLVALTRNHDADSSLPDRDLLEWDEQRPPAITAAAFEAFLARETRTRRGLPAQRDRVR